MAAAFAEFGFVRAIFFASLTAIVLQCLVYAVRHVFGLAAARIVLRGSLIGFLAITVIALAWAGSTGDFSAAIDAMGWSPVIDFAMFIVFTMFITYFMGDRYLADQAQREARSREDPERSDDSAAAGLDQGA